MKAVAGHNKRRRRVLRKLSEKLPTQSASIRVPVAVFGLAAYGGMYLFGAEDSFLLQIWPFCVLLGITLEIAGGFLLAHGRAFVGDVVRVVGFVFVNLGMALFVVWGWASGEEAWFWYAMLVYGAFVVLMLGWSSDEPRVPRVR